MASSSLESELNEINQEEEDFPHFAMSPAIHQSEERKTNPRTNTIIIQ